MAPYTYHRRWEKVLPRRRFIQRLQDGASLATELFAAEIHSVVALVFVFFAASSVALGAMLASSQDIGFADIVHATRIQSTGQPQVAGAQIFNPQILAQTGDFEAVVYQTRESGQANGYHLEWKRTKEQQLSIAVNHNVLLDKGPSIGSVDFQVPDGAVTTVEIFSRPDRRGSVLASVELAASTGTVECGLELPPLGCVYRLAGPEENAGLCGMVLDCVDQGSQPGSEGQPLAVAGPTE